MPLAVTNQDLPITKIHILDPQLQAFTEPQPLAVEQACHQPFRTAQLFQQCTRFLRSKHRRASYRGLGVHEPVEPWKGRGKNFLVKKQQRSQRLVLRRRGDVARGSKIGQERRYLRRSQLTRVAFSREKYEALDPMEIRLFSPATIVEPADGFTRQVKQPRALCIRYWYFHDMVIHSLTPLPHAGLR